MLLKFKVNNFLSFGKEMEFSMAKTSSISRFSNRVHKGKVDVLKVRSIRGANGSGKSNLIKALKYLQRAVLEGEFNVEDYYKYCNVTDSRLKNKPIEIFIEFMGDIFGSENLVYSYYLKFNSSRILEEKFYSEEDSTFFKIYNEEKENYSFYKNDSEISKPDFEVSIKTNDELKNFKVEREKNELIFDNLENEMSFNTIIFNHLLSTLNFETEHQTQITEGLNHLFNNEDAFNKFKEIICTIDTGISDIKLTKSSLDDYFGKREISRIRVIKQKIDEEESLFNFDSHSDNIGYVHFDSQKNEYLYFYKIGKKYYVKYFLFFHNSKNKKEILFNRNMESDGTKRVLDLYPKLLSALFTDSIWFFDEIEKSIHPNLLHQFVTKLLEFPNIKGQIIFTTHDTSLLDLNIFRQDEICFVQKNEYGNSEFYLLSDFDNIRNDLDIKKGYENGRFGAIPFLEELKEIKIG